MPLQDSEVSGLREKLERRRASLPTPGPKLSPQQREQLVRDYLEDPDASFASVGRKYGISTQAACYLVKRAAR